ncbi:DMT family transporter [Oxalobacter paeniformigenes]|uniref:DMT family transporter n=1 Tax=Oxalobacter paeniformigenes TaxID=2946594 RepID=UPI0038B336C5
MQSLWMLFATFLFSLMGVCVKLVSDEYSTPEIVMYRSLVGAIFLGCLVAVRGGSLKTAYPFQHLWRGVVGATAFGLWFFSFRGLPLATAMTLNYMSPIWIAGILFAMGLYHGKVRFEWKLVCAIVASFIGVVLLLQPTIHADQLQSGMIALVSGVLAALAYLQVRHLGNLGEPEYRVVFYFCIIGTVGGALVSMACARLPGSDGIAFHSHSIRGIVLLTLIGVFAAVGQMAMTRAYHLGKTLVTANLQYSGIVFSSIWGILIWQDFLGWIGWLGMIVIIGSGVSTTFFDVRHKMASTMKTYEKAKKMLEQKTG